MAIIGQYKYNAVTSGSAATDAIYNIAAFKLSGLGNTAGIACCLYKYDATKGWWIPYI